MRRFTSRRFLITLGALFAALAAVLQGDLSAEQLGALVLAVVSVVAYVLGESQVDTARAAAGEETGTRGEPPA